MNVEASETSPPRSYEGLRALLIERREKLPRRLIQVAAYAIENPNEIAFGTVASVAKQAQVQPSTLIRFAQTLGYAGFTDLQAVFRSQLKSHWPDYQERLNRIGDGSDSNPGTDRPLLSGFTDAAIASIERLRATVSTADMEHASKLLARSQSIYLLGLRRVFPVSSYLSYALAKLGMKNILVDQIAGLGPEQLGGASHQDCLVAISFAPYAQATVELVADAAERKVPVVVITDSPFSPLAPHASVSLEVVEADFNGFRSLSATLALAMTLAVAAATEREHRE